MSATLHASAVLIGAKAMLIRGPAGSGKSSLVLALLRAAQSGILPFGRLVADDRVHAAAVHGRLVLRPPPALAGLLEVRGLGLRRLPWEPAAVAGWIVDLAAGDAQRLPGPEQAFAEIEDIRLPRIAIPRGYDILPPILAAVALSAASASAAPP